MTDARATPPPRARAGRLRSIALVLAIALATWAIALVALPRVIMRVAMSRLRAGALADATDPRVRERDGWNVAIAAPPTTAASRTIVRPSPDLLYVACLYDLAHGPVVVRAPRSSTYLSLSGFAANTDNFFALNDRGADAGSELAIALVPAGSPDALPAGAAGARRVESPSERGIVLARLRVESPAQIPDLRELQARVSCEPAR